MSVPGLVSSLNEGTVAGVSQVIASSAVTEDRSSFGGGLHRLLAPPDAFNVSILFGPTLSFLDRVKDVMPGGLMGDDDKGFGGFLDEFVLNIFLPQLEDKVTSVFQQAVGAADAFQTDPTYRRISSVPLFRVRPQGW